MIKPSWEKESKDHFLEVLESERNAKWKVLRENVVVDPQTNRNYDYELGRTDADSPPIALELFRLIENKQELARRKVWGEIVELLKNELISRGVKGYLIRTPSFQISKVKRKERARRLADQIETAISQHAAEKEFSVEGFEITRIHDLQTVVFSTFGHGGAVSPVGTALAALEEKLPDKNDQLFVKGHERVVLVVNWEIFVAANDVIAACSRIDFDHLPNIDKVYFESSKGKIELVFDRSLFESFRLLSDPPNRALDQLFILWLGFRLARKDVNAFNLVKKLTAERGHCVWLPRFSRESVVHYGDDFIEARNWNDVEWIVQNFRDDPNPCIGNEADDPEGRFNYHEKTKRGEDVHTITSVRGHLSWLLQKIVVEGYTHLYPLVYEVIESYACGENLYIRQQSTVPLVELIRRRRALQPDHTPFMDDALAQKIKALSFHLLRSNAAYPSVLGWIAHVFAWSRDLNEEEAKEAIDILINNVPAEGVDDVCVFLIYYYALFRKTNFTNDGPFDEIYFANLLKAQLIGGRTELRSMLLWRIGKLLEEEATEFPVLEPYISSVPRGSFEPRTFFHFFDIASHFMAHHPTPLCWSFRQALQREREFHGTIEKGQFWDNNLRSKCLNQIIEAGETKCFLECVSELVQYMHRVVDFSIVDLCRQLKSIQEPDWSPQANLFLEILKTRTIIH
jgi:hypothetical protein